MESEPSGDFGKARDPVVSVCAATKVYSVIHPENIHAVNIHPVNIRQSSALRAIPFKTATDPGAKVSLRAEAIG